MLVRSIQVKLHRGRRDTEKGGGREGEGEREGKCGKGAEEDGRRGKGVTREGQVEWWAGGGIERKGGRSQGREWVKRCVLPSLRHQSPSSDVM